MTSLACRVLAQTEWPDLIWISARISEIGETSLDPHGLQHVYIYSGKTKGVLALGRCPGPIGCLLYLYLFTFTKELQGILPIWDVMQSDLCMMGEISGMGLK